MASDILISWIFSREEGGIVTSGCRCRDRSSEKPRVSPRVSQVVSGRAKARSSSPAPKHSTTPITLNGLCEACCPACASAPCPCLLLGPGSRWVRPRAGALEAAPQCLMTHPAPTAPVLREYRSCWGPDTGLSASLLTRRGG